METGSELSKTVAIFIVQKILLDDMGLQYICQTYERFYAVGTVLSNMVTQLVDQQTVRLLKHVVRCFLRYIKSSSIVRCITNSVSDFQIMPAPARLSVNVSRSPSETPPFLRSCETMPLPSVVWLNFYWPYPIRPSPP
jgi:hypothetical protein